MKTAFVRTTRFLLLPTLILAITRSGFGAQSTDAAPGDAALAAYFKAETAHISDRCLADVRTLDDWQRLRARYRAQLFEMLGLSPLPPRGELRAAVTGRVEHD